MKFASVGRSIVLGIACSGLLVAAQSGAKQPLTVTRALETARVIVNPGSIGPANPQGAVSVSPDGTRYLLRSARGDVKHNGVWMEIKTGRLDSFEAAQDNAPVARLFTSGLGAGIGNFGSDNDVSEYSALRWLGNERVVFLWSDTHSVRQVVQVDLRTGKVDFLTDHPTAVANFDISRDGAVLYNARARRPTAQSEDLKNGLVLPKNVDAYSLFYGDLSATGFDVAWNTEWFIRDGPTSAARQLQIAGRDIDLMSWHTIKFAPDGKRALVTSAPRQYPEEWSRYTGYFKVGFTEARRDARSSAARVVQQLFVLDTANGVSRPLWNAPSAGSEVQWSPDGQFVLAAPVYLPPGAADEEADALEGEAAAIVDASTGSYRRLKLELLGRRVAALRWISAGEVQIETRRGDDIRSERFQRQGNEWCLAGATVGAQDEAPPLRIELRQDLNSPPRVYAVELRDGRPSGREKMLFDPNPRLTEEVALGRVEKVEGKLDGEDKWAGLLFYPVDYRAGQRYPLLIQSVYGEVVSSNFTLYGLGSLGPTPVASYPGQVMANRGVAVLHLNVHMGSKFGTSAEAATRQKGIEAAAEHMISTGLAERTKVGLAGFSRNGWYVEYVLTHSSFPFAAAIVADNWDPSYMPTTWFGTVGQSSAANGGEPFGAGLKAWLESAPGFNVERIHVPLRKIEQSTGGLFGVVAGWEIYSRLLHLKKPVEYYIMPDAAAHGAHNTQNPGQISAVQQGSVDWFDFWLNDREDADPRKAGQYLGWRTLRELHKADVAQAKDGKTQNR